MDLARDPSLLAPTSCGDAPCFTHVSPSVVLVFLRNLKWAGSTGTAPTDTLHVFAIIAQKQQRVAEAVASCMNTIKLQFLQH